MVSYSGDRSVYKTGYNNGVAGTEVDIRSDDADLTYSTTAQALEIVSSSTADDNIATGTLTLVSCVPLTAASGTVQFNSAVANTFATGTVTLASALAIAAATGTITCATVLATQTVTVNGLLYTAVAGVKANNTEFSVDTGNNECATDLADSITNDSRSGTLNDVTAVAATNVVTCTQTVAGAGGNATTLESSSGVTLAVSGATFANGVDADTATINGLAYTAVSGAKANNTQFSIDTSDTAAATDLAASVTADVRSGTSGDVTATSAVGVVTCTTTVTGTGGNTITLASSDGGRLALSGATFSGGVTADTITANGLVYTAVAGARANNTQFSIDTSDDAAATDFAAAVNADSRSGTLNDLTAAAVTDTVTLTQTVGGTGGNATTLASSSDAVRLVISGATFTGGLAADVATVNGLTYTGVAGARANNTQFSTDGNDTANATDLAAAINADTRTPVTVPTVDVVATSATGVVTINAATAGTAGNTIDISGTSNITASAATLTDVSTGARTVLVEGLDGDYNEISETVNLNGTIAVDLVNTYLRVNGMSVVTAGTGLTNAGTITLRLDAAGATQGVISIGDSNAHFTNYTVPARYKGEIVLIDCDIDKSGDNDVRLKTRDNGVTGAPWQTDRIIRVTEQTSPLIFNNDELIFNEKTDIKFTSIRVTGADDDRISCNYTLVLHRQF